MSLYRKTQFVIGVLALLAGVWGVSTAADAPMFPYYNLIGKGEKVAKYPGYPLGFDGIGTLDVIEKDRIIINDSLFLWDHSTRFGTPYSPYISISNMDVGDKVGYVINDTEDRAERSPRTLKGVWIIPDSEKK